MNLLGDGYCDDQANTEQCSYDMNDCCYYEINCRWEFIEEIWTEVCYTDYELSRSLCTDCFCHADIESQLAQMHSRCEIYQGIIVCDEWGELGDGKCDSRLNNVDDFFDAGDCCYDERNQNQCIQSNIFCNPKTLGDGICQDYNNGPFCDYDLGDCCLLNGEIDKSECCVCICLHQWQPMMLNNKTVYWGL